MGIIQASCWGVAGGAAAALISLMTDVTGHGFRWPWQATSEEIWPRLFVLACALLLGGLVAAAAHTQMTGPWPAFLMGVSAPSIVRGALSRVEVRETKQELAASTQDKT